MRKSKKQLLRTMIACGLVVSVAAGGTVAYLTDAETATNTFTVGKVKIDLEEPGYPGNDSDEVKNIIPNQEIVKGSADREYRQQQCPGIFTGRGTTGNVYRRG